MDEPRKVASFHIQRPREKARLLSLIYQTKHVQNMILILDREAKTTETVSSFLDPEVMRAVVADTSGGKKSEEVSRLLDKFNKHQIFREFIECTATLKEKNIHALVKRLKGACLSYSSKKKTRPWERVSLPKPAKLKALKNFSIPLDQMSVSFKRKNLIRINFNKKMEDYHVRHAEIAKACGDIKAVKNCEICFKNGEIYLSLIYDPSYKKVDFEPKIIPTKRAGLDLGLINLASIFVEDVKTPSLIIKGSAALSYNHLFNYRLHKLQRVKDLLRNRIHATQGLVKEEVTKLESQKLYKLEQKISRFYGQRNRHFFNLFHKLARRVLEYCVLSGVSELFVSRNLGKAKQEEGLNTKFNQSFCQIPLLKLIDYLMLYGESYGIKVIDIDEAYTSKSSCINGSVVLAQNYAHEGIFDERLTNVLQAKRVKRHLVKDSAMGRHFLADLNGAFNHIRVGAKLMERQKWLENCLWKLANPVVVIGNSLFLDTRLLRNMGKELLPSGDRGQYAAKFFTRFTF